MKDNIKNLILGREETGGGCMYDLERYLGRTFVVVMDGFVVCALLLVNKMLMIALEPWS